MTITLRACSGPLRAHCLTVLGYVYSRVLTTRTPIVYVAKANYMRSALFVSVRTIRGFSLVEPFLLANLAARRAL